MAKRIIHNHNADREKTLQQEKDPLPSKEQALSTAALVAPDAFQRIQADAEVATPDNILTLQHVLGNRAVGHLIQPGTVRAQPGTVRAQPGGVVQRAAPEEEEIQTMPLVQRQAEGDFVVGKVLCDQLGATQKGGNPLPHKVRSFMEPRFGADFGKVRLHTDDDAAKLSYMLNAQAFTYGQDIYLGKNRDQLDSDAGKRLLAHELTHIMQQPPTSKTSGQTKVEIGPGRDPTEQEADRVAQKVSGMPDLSQIYGGERALWDTRLSSPPAYLRSAFNAGQMDVARYRQGLHSFRQGNPNHVLDQYNARLGERVTPVSVQQTSPLQQVRRKGRGEDEGMDFSKIDFEKLKEADAPKNLKLPKELTEGMKTAWKGSFPGEESQEQGGVLVKTDKGGYKWKAGKGGESGSFDPNYKDVDKGESLIGVGHTHPYSKKEGGHEDVSFSGADLSRLIYVADRAAFVQAGKTQFTALRTEEFDKLIVGLDDPGKKKMSDEMDKTWQDTYDNAKGTFQEKVEAAVKAVCTKYHLVYYKGKGSTVSKV